MRRIKAYLIGIGAAVGALAWTAVFTLVWPAVPALAAASVPGSRVDDQADLFMPEEEAALSEYLEELSREMNMDLIFVSAEETGGLSSKAWADQYYIRGGYGVGEEYSGAVFLIDMDNREVTIATEGAMEYFLTDSRVDEALELAVSPASRGDYLGTAMVMAESAADAYEQGIPKRGWRYDKASATVSYHRNIAWYEALLAAAVSLFCGGTACKSVKKQYSMEEERQQASNYRLAYRADARFVCEPENDVLADKSTSRMVIPRISPGARGGFRGGRGGFGGGGSFGGGRRMGGGSRKF